MDRDRVRANPRQHRRTDALSIRVTPDIKRWLKQNHLSPTKIFYEAIKELGYRRRER